MQPTPNWIFQMTGYKTFGTSCRPRLQYSVNCERLITRSLCWVARNQPLTQHSFSAEYICTNIFTNFLLMCIYFHIPSKYVVLTRRCYKALMGSPWFIVILIPCCRWRRCCARSGTSTSRSTRCPSARRTSTSTSSQVSFDTTDFPAYSDTVYSDTPHWGIRRPVALVFSYKANVTDSNETWPAGT